MDNLKLSTILGNIKVIKVEGKIIYKNELKKENRNKILKDKYWEVNK